MTTETMTEAERLMKLADDYATAVATSGRTQEARSALQSQAERIKELEAKMVPLEKDAARLDWLEQDHLGRVFHIVNNWYTRKSYGMPWTKRKDLRAAIDAAMGITGEPK